MKEFENIDGLGRFKPWNQPLKEDDATPAADHLSKLAGVFVVSDPVDWSRDLQVSSILHSRRTICESCCSW